MNQYLDLIVLSLLIMLSVTLIYIRIMRNRIPWWGAYVNRKNMHSSRGGVYVAYSPKVGRIVKVGTTQRWNMTERMKEIERTMTGYPVKLLFALDKMPFAWSVEQEAHRLLKKKRIVFAKGSPMGVEWVSCRAPEELQEIIDAVEMAAKAVRLHALNMGCWPKGASPVIVDMRNGKISKKYIFNKENSPGVKIAS